MKVVIIGGGVMGMMQARELSQRGWEVVLVDKGICGGEASWAGGGIISPLYPWRYSDPVTALASWSQGYYPNLIQCLEAESGVDPEITRHGLLMLEVKDREQALVWSEKRQPAWLEQIPATALYEYEPLLRPGVAEALWMPHICSIRNPRLLRALRMILEHEPLVTIVEENAFAGMEREGESERVTAITTVKDRRIEADRFIFCSGAWTSSLLPEAGLKVAPVKGQMILFDAVPGIVNRIVLNQGRYVIPRRDGRIVAGSTLEYTEFDKSTTAEAKETLADLAIDMFPRLAEYPISHHWSGLRPGSPAGVPYIGLVPGYRNVYVNAGHFRNGLVLAPASVRLMSSILCGDEPPVNPGPYDPGARVI